MLMGTTHRQGESGSIPFRSGRFFCVDSDWYFLVREGGQRGPYLSRGDAEIALGMFVQAQGTSFAS